MGPGLSLPSSKHLHRTVASKPMTLHPRKLNIGHTAGEIRRAKPRWPPFAIDSVTLSNKILPDHRTQMTSEFHVLRAGDTSRVSRKIPAHCRGHGAHGLGPAALRGNRRGGAARRHLPHERQPHRRTHARLGPAVRGDSRTAGRDRRRALLRSAIKGLEECSPPRPPDRSSSRHHFVSHGSRHLLARGPRRCGKRRWERYRGR